MHRGDLYQMCGWGSQNKPENCRLKLCLGFGGVPAAQFIERRAKRVPGPKLFAMPLSNLGPGAEGSAKSSEN